MKAENDIERTLEQMGRDWPSGASIADSVIRRLEAEKRSPPPMPARKRSVRVLLAAAALLAAVGTWSYLRVEENSLSAQVIRAMDAAQSLDVVTLVQSSAPKGGDRGLVKGAEAWFVEGLGFRYDWGDEIRVGNDKYFWRYNPRAKTAVRSASGGIRKLLNDWFDMHKFAKELQADFDRDPAADRTFKSERLRAYRLTRTARYADRELQEGRRRLIVFLDSRSRIARVEHLLQQKGAWLAISVDEWSYDVSVDPKLFEPNFGSGVKVIDADRAFDDLVDLQKAVHVENRSGLIYAVHRVERFEGGGILVMSSVRGDEETLKKFPLQRRMIQLGLYHDDGPAMSYPGSGQGNGYFRIALASASHQGIEVLWWLQVPRGQPANYFEVDSNQVWIDASVTPSGEYANTHRDQRGLIHNLAWRLQLKVPKPHPLPTLKAIAESAYADVAMLDALPPFDVSLDLGVDDTSGHAVGKRGSPVDTTPAQFAEAVERQIRWWSRQDIESQFRFAQNQFNIAPNQDTGFVQRDTFALNFIPGVGDAELARLKSLTGVKRVYLRGTGITDGGLASLSGLAQLETLDLSDTAISDAGLEHLAALHKLKEVDLKNTRVTVRGVGRLKSANPGVRVTFN